MAQTTSAYSGTNTVVEFSTNGSSWTNISSAVNMVDPGEQTRQSGEDYTFDGVYAIVTGGKIEPVEVSCKGLHTPTGGEAFAVVQAAFVAQSAGYLRWSPQGGASGQKRYTTAAGIITSLMWPKGDASDPKPTPTAFKIKVPSITESTI